MQKQTVPAGLDAHYEGPILEGFCETRFLIFLLNYSHIILDTKPSSAIIPKRAKVRPNQKGAGL